MGSALVLFDIDGTLVRGAGPHHKLALIEGIRKATGIATHLEGVATAGMLDCDLVTAMLQAADASHHRRRELMARIFEECQDAYEANCPEDLSAFVCPGVREVLAELRRRGTVLGLVTGNLSRIARRKMERAGIGDYFSVGAFAEDAGTRVELARIARERAVEGGLARREAKVSLIGDHPNDIRAAKANGFQAIGVATGVVGREELAMAEPDVLVGTLRELEVGRLF